MTERAFDVVVLGAGPAGEVVAGKLADGGLSVALVEPELVGGECSFWACMPSKALIAAADAFHSRTYFEEFGIRNADALAVDMPAVLHRVRALRDHFVSGVLKSTEGLGPRNIEGRARLDGPNRLIVGEHVIEEAGERGAAAGPAGEPKDRRSSTSG